MFYKADNLCNFLFAFLQKGGLLSKTEVFAPTGSEFFPLRVEAFSNGVGAKQFDRIAYLKNISSIHFKIGLYIYVLRPWPAHFKLSYLQQTRYTLLIYTLKISETENLNFKVLLLKQNCSRRHSNIFYYYLSEKIGLSISSESAC